MYSGRFTAAFATLVSLVWLFLHLPRRDDADQRLKRTLTEITPAEPKGRPEPEWQLKPRWRVQYDVATLTGQMVWSAPAIWRMSGVHGSAWI